MDAEPTGVVSFRADKKPGAAPAAPARHRRYELPCTPKPTRLGPLIRQLQAEALAEVKDKSYRRSPVGETVGRYIDSVAYANTQNTADSYEQPLAWLALAHDDLAGVGEFCDRPEMLEFFLHTNWGQAAEKTRAHRWAVLNLFFKWCLERGLINSNPMQGIKRPKNPRIARERQAYEQQFVAFLIDAQPLLRDRVALGLLRLAIRKNDLRMLQIRDIDLALDQIRLNHAKGGKRHKLPIVFDDLCRDLSAHLLDRKLEAGRDPADEYLLYPRSHRERPMNQATVHRWFKRCLERAGLPDTVQMHELRHTAADHIWRTTGNLVLAQKLLRHESPATTAGYLHPTEDDLRAGLRAVEATFHRRAFDDFGNPVVEPN